MAQNQELEQMINVHEGSMDDYVRTVKFALGLLQDDAFRERNPNIKLDGCRGPFLVLGKPGIGKTEGVSSILRELEKEAAEKGIKMQKFRRNPETDELEVIGEEPLKWKLISIRLGQLGVGEISGIPDPSNKMKLVPYDRLPRVERDGQYGVLFLDELTSAMLEQTSPAGSLLDTVRGINGYKLPPRWTILAAGNDPQCKNFVTLNEMTVSRFPGGVFVVEPSFDSWYKWAITPETSVNEEGTVEKVTSKIVSRILAYLKKNPHKLLQMGQDYLDLVHSFEKDVSPLFPCPRTWAGLSNAIRIQNAYALMMGKTFSQVVPNMRKFAQAYIGYNEASEFAAFWEYDKYCVWRVSEILAGTAPFLNPDLQLDSDEDPHMAVEMKEIIDFQMEIAQKTANDRRTPVFTLKAFEEHVKQIGTNGISVDQILNDVLYITTEEIIQELVKRFEDQKEKGFTGEYTEKGYNFDIEVITNVANVVNWYLNAGRAETVRKCLTALEDAVPEVKNLMSDARDTRFTSACPYWKQFVASLHQKVESYQKER